MSKCKKMTWLFAILGVLLSDVMCAVVASHYTSLALCSFNSAPPSVAFLYAVPFLIGIGICAALAWHFHKKA